MGSDHQHWNNAAAQTEEGRAVDRMPTDMLVRFRAAERVRIRLRNARIWQTVRIVAIAGAAIATVLWAAFH